MKLLVCSFLIMAVISIDCYPQKAAGVITGQVVSEATKEPIPGVNILIIGTGRGTVSDSEGNFRIADLEIGTYQIRASVIGCKTVIKPDIILNSARPAIVFIKMTQIAIELEGVTVKSDYFENNRSETGSIANFSYEEIRRAPGGFEDIIRALSVLPGVAQASAGRNDLVVRGGAPSENLYLIDGFIVPNINHFGTQGATGGPISFVNLDFVRETSFSSGGFSALYGDKVSSVLNIDLRDGRSDGLGGKATIAASEFGLNLEGPLSDKGTFLISARRSYLDFIFNAAGFSFVPQYYDLLSKFSYEISSKNKISFLFIGAFDNVKYNNNNSKDLYDNSRILGSNQNSYVSGISWRHLFDKGLFSATVSRTYTNYDTSQRDTLLNPIFLDKSSEAENVFKADLVYQISKASEIDAGFLINEINFDADIKLPSFMTTFGDRLSLTALNTSRNFSKLALYIQGSHSFADKIQLTLGVREDYFGEITDKYYLSPRFSISYAVSDFSKINLSAGIYHQTPSYIWLVAFDSNKDLKSVRVNQFILGWEERLMEDLRVKLEGFVKEYSDYPASTLRPYLVLANTGGGYGGSDDNFSSYGLEPLSSSGSGSTHGIELSVQKKSSDMPLYGIVSITWSESKFTALDGISRFGNYDQKWIINISGGYIFDKKWEASFKFRFASGSPYTPFNSDGTQSIVNLNSERFKPLHSLDLRVDRRWNFEKWALISYLDIQNIYNNKNSNIVRWDYRKNAVDFGSSIGILPSIGVSLEF